MKLVEHEVYPEMYFIELQDGVLSKDFYNKTRATELLKRLENGEKEDKIKIGYTIND